MGKSKTIKRRKTTRKLNKKRGSRSMKYRGGECPCKNKTFGGYGQPSFKSFDQIPTSSVIPVNSQSGPTNPISSRMLGGEKHVRFSKRDKIIRGGFDGISSFGNLAGVSDLKNTMNLTQTVNPAPYSQPILNLFGENNVPLV
jgi:hypothetical protein